MKKDFNIIPRHLPAGVHRVIKSNTTQNPSQSPINTPVVNPYTGQPYISGGGGGDSPPIMEGDGNYPYPPANDDPYSDVFTDDNTDVIDSETFGYNGQIPYWRREEIEDNRYDFDAPKGFKTLTVNKPSGFKCLEPIIAILDNEGQPFYIYRNRMGVCHFNLPKGTFYTKNIITPAAFRIYKKYKVKGKVYEVKYPTPEKNVKIPKNITYIFAPNKNKASIFLESAISVIDPAILNKPLPKPFLTYIKKHEAFHYLYDSEEKCDRAAQVYMLKNGYNLTQVGEANTFCLGKYNEERKQLTSKFAKSII